MHLSIAASKGKVAGSGGCRFAGTAVRYDVLRSVRLVCADSCGNADKMCFRKSREEESNCGDQITLFRRV